MFNYETIIIDNEVVGTYVMLKSIREYLEEGKTDEIVFLFRKISSDENLTSLLNTMLKTFVAWSKNWEETGYM